MAENADDHCHSPAQRLQDVAKKEHGDDLGDLPDLHHRPDPVGGNINHAAVPFGTEKRKCPDEEALMHRGIDEGHHE